LLTGSKGLEKTFSIVPSPTALFRIPDLTVGLLLTPVLTVLQKEDFIAESSAAKREWIACLDSERAKFIAAHCISATFASLLTCGQLLLHIILLLQRHLLLPLPLSLHLLLL
jgi:hypothetical protein